MTILKIIFQFKMKRGPYEDLVYLGRLNEIVSTFMCVYLSRWKSSKAARFTISWRKLTEKDFVSYYLEWIIAIIVKFPAVRMDDFCMTLNLRKPVLFARKTRLPKVLFA